MLLPAVILVLAVLRINSISTCGTSAEGSSACHTRLKQDPALPFVPSPVFSSFRIMTPMLVPRSSSRVKATTPSAVPDNLSFLTVARSLSLMLYSIESLLKIILFFFRGRRSELPGRAIKLILYPPAAALLPTHTSITQGEFRAIREYNALKSCN